MGFDSRQQKLVISDFEALQLISLLRNFRSPGNKNASFVSG